MTVLKGKAEMIRSRVPWLYSAGTAATRAMLAKEATAIALVIHCMFVVCLGGDEIFQFCCYYFDDEKPITGCEGRRGAFYA